VSDFENAVSREDKHSCNENEGGAKVMKKRQYWTMAAIAVLSVMLMSSVTFPVSAQNEGPAGEEAVGLDITDKQDLVAIHYSIWHNPVVKEGMPIYDIRKIQEEAARNNEAPKWGPLYAFHFLTEPALGYYNNRDAHVIRTHMEQLSKADIDFIIVDNTNANSGWPASYYNEIFVESSQFLLDTMLAMREEGLRTPYVVFWTGSWSSDPNPSFSGMDIYNRLYESGVYDDLFVYYEGKPLLLVTDQQPDQLKERFTLRKMWGLQGQLAEKEWSFLQESPQNVAMNNGQPEQITVTTSHQRDYMSSMELAEPRFGGNTWWRQWKRAYEVRPKVVTVTWWNEWIAQRFEDERGESRFVDLFAPEYSRDIEPAKDGYKDQYYKWLKKYVRNYKDHKPLPAGLVDAFPIGDFEMSESAGKEGWKAVANVSELLSVSESAPGTPEAAHGYKLLEVRSGDQIAADAPVSVRRTFFKPVDWTQMKTISYSLRGNNGVRDAESYRTSITVTSEVVENGATTLQTLYEEYKVPNPEAWHKYQLKIKDWPYRDRIKSVEIAFWAEGGSEKETGSVYLDRIFVEP
jgi:hypothetical protein